jgi:hypothetical protein
MSERAGPVVGAVVGVLALIGLSVSLLTPSSHKGFAEAVEDLLEAEERATPRERHANVEARLAELQPYFDDSRFAKLPVRLRDGLSGLRTELEAYRDYERRVERVPPLKKVASDADLDRWEKDVKAIAIPLAYPSWEQTEAGERHAALLKEAAALRAAVDAARRGYSRLVIERDELFRDPNAPGVPARAKKLLEEAKGQPTPDDALKRIPGSSELTYAEVFTFPSVKTVYEQWTKGLDIVRRTAALAK